MTLYLNVTLKVSLDVAVLFFELIHRVEYGWVGMVPLEDFGEPSTRQMVILDMSQTVLAKCNIHDYTRTSLDFDMQVCSYRHYKSYLAGQVRCCYLFLGCSILIT